MPKYQATFTVTTRVHLLCKIDVEAFNEDVGRDVAEALANHLSARSNAFSIQCTKTGATLRGVVEVDTDKGPVVEIGSIYVSPLGESECLSTE